MKGLGCQCSNIPSNIKIIKVGDSEVGIVDLMKIIRQTYFKRIENESALKEELVRRVKEKNILKIIEPCVELGISAVWMPPGSWSEMAIRRCEENQIQYAHDVCIVFAVKVSS
jgi:hypothetical protein